MSVLINAYCTHRDPPALEFPHELNSRRDWSDPAVPEHLEGFMGYVVSRRCGEEMTQILFHVLGHIRRVQHQISVNIEDADLDAFARWGWEANAICFLPDGTVRDPAGAVLVYPGDRDADPGAEIPFPRDAHERKRATDARLGELSFEIPPTLPPVASEVEVELRLPVDISRRALALFAVALRAETLASGEPIPVSEIRERMPLAFAALSPNEAAFLSADEPQKQQIVDSVWRYEALLVILWALGLVDELSLPTGICDVPQVARIMKEAPAKNPKLRPTGELLDALDLTYRLHWAVRQARLDGVDPPGGLESGVIAERHYALNWLVRFGNADWDDVETPT